MRTSSKQLRFPLGGYSSAGSYRETTYPSDGEVYCTPRSLNVIGSDSVGRRLRGGSRPGLVRVVGDIGGTRSRWLWPNGEVILWPDGKEMTFLSPNGDLTMPDGSRIIAEHAVEAVYRNRLIKADGTVWSASRTGNFGDFAFVGEENDVTQAVAGNIANAGRSGETITALAPFGDSRLYIATNRSIGVIVGEPTSGLAILSENVGIIGADAWCNADGSLYFIGENGMYAVSDGAPLLVSQNLPTELRGLTYALLVYDPSRRGIHVFTDRDDWYFEIDARAFWKVSYPARMMPDAGGRAVIDGENRVVFHCVDGAWRYWDDDADDDDGETIESSVTIGPFKCGVGDDGDGLLDSLNVTTEEDSSDVSIGVVTSHSAQGAIDGTPQDDGFTACGGWNCIVRPRRRGAWCCVTLSSSGKWAYEGMQANIKSLGGLRP